MAPLQLPSPEGPCSPWADPRAAANTPTKSLLSFIRETRDAFKNLACITKVKSRFSSKWTEGFQPKFIYK
jgi:hypothetical protein